MKLLNMAMKADLNGRWSAGEIITYMESLRDDVQRQVLMGFFKTGAGEYGYGDEFLGIKVPQTREVVKMVARDTPLGEISQLLMCRWHEVRLCGLLILVWHFERLASKRLMNDGEAIKGRDEILMLYLKYAERANNWDLVDLSVPKILGHWLMLPTALGDRDYKLQVLDQLAASPCLWLQRMSIVCTWKTSQMGDASWCLRYAEMHLHQLYSLMGKAATERGQGQARLSHAEREQARLMSMAVGWMLREMGKRVSMDLLRDFLRQHAHKMPRTALRYAIEKMDDGERKYWLTIPADFK